MDNKIVPFRTTPDRQDLIKPMPFPVFQAHCDERKFVYAGAPGRFDVYCRLGPERCNHSVCPVWNSDKIKSKPQNVLEKKPQEPAQTLREINLRLKRPPIKDGFDQQCEAHGIKRRVSSPATVFNNRTPVNAA